MKRMRKYYMLIVMGLLIGMSFSAFNPVQAHGIDPVTNMPISLSGTGTATIDGIIDPTEWVNADSMNFTLLDFVNGTVLHDYPIGTSPLNGIIYVMNDACRLYIGVIINDANLSAGDLITVTFDDDHDTWLEACPPFGYPTNGGGEDMIAVSGADVTEDRYIVSPYGSYVTSAYDPVSNDVMGAATSDGTLSYFELAHCLDSADDDHDFDLSGGDTVGFTLGYSSTEQGETHVWPTWVYGTSAGMTGPLTGYQNASEFGDIVINDMGPCVVPATVGIGPQTLNLKSNGKWVTCTIELPPEYDVNDIDVSTVLFNGVVQVDKVVVEGDTLVLKFSRSEVEDLFMPGEHTITITGEFYEGTEFEGSDTITVIDPPK
jgi:hypothetical protein